MEHRLKCWPEYYEAIKRGLKNFEVRKNDRGFAVGDTLILEEWHPGVKEYTGSVLPAIKVIYLLKDIPGIEPGYCVMGLEEP